MRGELINRTKSGQRLTIDSSTNPIFDETGAISGFLAIQRDVSARKERERLRRMFDRTTLARLVKNVAK